MIRKFIERITGIDKIKDELREEAEAAKQAVAEAERRKAEAEEAALKSLAEAEEAKKKEQLAKMSPKDRATANGEPWVDVLKTHVNKDNVRHGFFELDWNQLFVDDLIKSGFGTESDPPEEVVDRWFRVLMYDMYAEEGVDPNRGSGYINVVPIDKNRSEIY